jgi:serine/threonine-protein kinase
MREAPLPVARYVPILLQVADALSAAHAAGFVHRDLKPENIFLTQRHGHDDYVKLLDFGLAKSLAPESISASPGAPPAVRQHHTVEGTFLGTPAYASPEQASGKPVDRRSDIYSLGVILYELLCGRLPFEGANLGEYLVKHITMPPPAAPREVVASEPGRSLDLLAQRCLEKDPALRMSSAGEVKDNLERILRGEFGAPARPRWGSTHVLAGAAALLLLLVTTVLVTRGPRGKARSLPTSTARTGTIGPLIESLARRPAPRTTIRFDSSPPGAEVRRVGETELLGITPFSFAFERPPAGASARLEVEMRLPGHETERFLVDLARDATASRSLRRTAAVAGPRRPTRTREADREGTLDPFGQ